jgi:hypothetical protein
MAIGLLQTMFSFTPGALVPQWGLATIALAVAAWWSMVGPNAFEVELRAGWRRRATVTAAFAASLAIILGTRSSPFLYFQF